MRSQTTVAPQSLFTAHERHLRARQLQRRLADRVTAEAPNDRAKQLQRVWSLLYSKPATDMSDITKCLSYLDEQTKALTQYHHDIQHAKGVVPNPPQEAMASLCQILCSSNRFLYVE
jgi:hypothetical protein